MRAAVVHSFGSPPAYGEIPDPVAGEAGELVVDVVAAALHPRVRSQADGSHYSSTGALPLVPGVDAVVRDRDGRLRYAVLDDTALGTMAERTVIEARRSVVLPDDIDPIAVAAAMNPVMSSWVALRRRIDFRPGQRVLVLGATGAAGSMAVQVARRFGAARVVAAGRDDTRLRAVGADEVCLLDGTAAAADVDVVLDYLWGEPAATAMADLLSARADRSAPVSWIQIGSIAGATAPIPSAALRSTRLQIVGSGVGSVPGRDYVAELAELAAVAGTGVFDVPVRTVPLSAVERTWTSSLGAPERIVFVP